VPPTGQTSRLARVRPKAIRAKESLASTRSPPRGETPPSQDRRWRGISFAASARPGRSGPEPAARRDRTSAAATAGIGSATRPRVHPQSHGGQGSGGRNATPRAQKSPPVAGWRMGRAPSLRFGPPGPKRRRARRPAGPDLRRGDGGFGVRQCFAAFFQSRRSWRSAGQHQPRRRTEKPTIGRPRRGYG